MNLLALWHHRRDILLMGRIAWSAWRCGLPIEQYLRLLEWQLLQAGDAISTECAAVVRGWRERGLTVDSEIG